VRNNGGGDDVAPDFIDEADTYVLGVYATYKATDKLSLNGRAEYVHTTFNDDVNGFSFNSDGYEITGTVEYDLWANVITRAELRFDHQNNGGTSTFGDLDEADSLGLYANVIYKF
jgi:hypothetical protein